MRRTRYASTLLAVGVVLIALPAQGETLQDALSAAWLNNPALEAERDSAAIAGERIEQARAQRKPTVSLFGSYVYESVDSDRPFAFNLGEDEGEGEG